MGNETRTSPYLPWMRDTMGIDAIVVDDPRPGALRGVSHARTAFAARFSGFLAMLFALIALMLGARPADHNETAKHTTIANITGASLGALGVSGFVAGRAIERRTRHQVTLQTETRAIVAADVSRLLAAADERAPRDQLWIVGPAVDDDARTLAHTRGVRTFIRDAAKIREV